MRQRRQPGAEHIDPPDRHAIGQGHEHRDHHDIRGEENADQPARIGFRQVPAGDVIWKQRRQGEGSDLRQHLRGDDRLRVAVGSGRQRHDYAGTGAGDGRAFNNSSANNALRLSPAEIASTPIPI